MTQRSKLLTAMRLPTAKRFSFMKRIWVISAIFAGCFAFGVPLGISLSSSA